MHRPSNKVTPRNSPCVLDYDTGLECFGHSCIGFGPSLCRRTTVAVVVALVRRSISTSRIGVAYDVKTRLKIGFFLYATPLTTLIQSMSKKSFDNCIRSPPILYPLPRVSRSSHRSSESINYGLRRKLLMSRLLVNCPLADIVKGVPIICKIRLRI